MCYALFALIAVWYWAACRAAVHQINAETRARIAHELADLRAEEERDERDAERIARETDDEYYDWRLD